MADKIDMSLDEIIKSNRKPNSQRRSGAGNTRPNSQRQSNNRQNNPQRNGPGAVKAGNFNRQARRQSGPYSRPAPVNHTNGDRWLHDKFDGPNRISKLNISNLHFRVTEKDLQELFGEFGRIKKVQVFYDKSARSLGNAQVIFANFASAVAAKKRYNGVMLDGRPMNINVEGEGLLAGLVNNRLQKPRQVQNSGNNQQNRGPRNNQNRNAGQNKGNAKPKGQKQQKRSEKKPTQAELDADLDAYINKQN